MLSYIEGQCYCPEPDLQANGKIYKCTKCNGFREGKPVILKKRGNKKKE